MIEGRERGERGGERGERGGERGGEGGRERGVRTGGESKREVRSGDKERGEI